MDMRSKKLSVSGPLWLVGSGCLKSLAECLSLTHLALLGHFPELDHVEPMSHGVISVAAGPGETSAVLRQLAAFHPGEHRVANAQGLVRLQHVTLSSEPRPAPPSPPARCPLLGFVFSFGWVRGSAIAERNESIYLHQLAKHSGNTDLAFAVDAPAGCRVSTGCMDSHGQDMMVRLRIGRLDAPLALPILLETVAERTWGS